MKDKTPASTFAERVEGRSRLAALVREIEEQLKQRREDDAYDDEPTPERRKP